MEKTPRIYIYGSCVSRDAINTLPAGSYVLANYIARHSLLAAGTDISSLLPTDLGLPSNFQSRMVRQDWAGDSLQDLFKQADDIDLLLIDLVDERHGVHWFITGEVVTRSIDLINSEPALAQVQPHTHVPFGAQEHFEEWCEKADVFIQRLRENHLISKTRLLWVPWATHAADGTPAPTSMGLKASTANRLFARYYKYLINAGVACLRVPEELVLANPNHRWGFAPFHYSDAVYDYITTSLSQAALLKGTEFGTAEKP